MPGRTGLEALQLLQQDERTKKIPVMAFGNVGDSSAIACVKHGAVDYHLLSEVTTDELVDAYSGLDHGVGHFRPLSITRQRH